MDEHKDDIADWVDHLGTEAGDYQFFRTHAGYHVGHSAEGALALARAEALYERAREAGVVSLDWNDDPDLPGYWASLNVNDEVAASLGGIEFDAKLGLDGDPYRRVVEAELALEAEDAIRQALEQPTDGDGDYVATVPIPFGLVERDLVLDPAAAGGADWNEERAWIGRYCTEEEAERIFRSAVLLANVKAGTFAQCLRTAIIWERG